MRENVSEKEMKTGQEQSSRDVKSDLALTWKMKYQTIMVNVSTMASAMLIVNPSRQVRVNRIPIRWITSSVSKVDTRSRRSVHIRHDGLYLAPKFE